MATAAETAKATAERFAETGNQAFKESVEKSLAAFADMNSHSKRNMEAMVASVTAATKGAETLGAQVSAYAKSFLDSYLAEMNRWSDTVSGSVKESLRPINERVSAVVEQFQTAR